MDYTFLATLAFVLGTFYTASALQCYECAWTEFEKPNDLYNLANLAGDNKCTKHGEEFLASPSKTQTCSTLQSENTNICYKLVMKFKMFDLFTFSDMWVTFYGRGCDSKTPADVAKGEAEPGCTNRIQDYIDENQTPGAKDFSGDACGCNEDLCNSAGQIGVSLMSLMAVLVAAFYNF